MPQCRSQNITVGGAVGERYLTFQRQRLNLRRCNRRGLPFTQLYRDRIAVAIANSVDCQWRLNPPQKWRSKIPHFVTVSVCWACGVMDFGRSSASPRRVRDRYCVWLRAQGFRKEVGMLA